MIKCCSRFSACESLHKLVTSGILSSAIISNYVTSCAVIPLISVEPCIHGKMSTSVIHCVVGAEQCKIGVGKQKQYMCLLIIYFLFNDFYINYL